MWGGPISTGPVVDVLQRRSMHRLLKGGAFPFGRPVSRTLSSDGARTFIMDPHDGGAWRQAQMTAAPLAAVLPPLTSRRQF